MTRPVISALQNASARDIALQMLSGAYSGMPVTERGYLVGIIARSDILKSFVEPEFMSHK